MSSFPTTSTTLLANLAERESGIDQAEWNRFFALYYPVMVEFARARGAGDDSEDVVQEVLADLVKVFQAGRYVRGKGQFKSYLATMLRNELISRFRRMQAKSRVDGRARSPAVPPATPSGDDSVSRSESMMIPFRPVYFTALDRRFRSIWWQARRSASTAMPPVMRTSSRRPLRSASARTMPSRKDRQYFSGASSVSASM